MKTIAITLAFEHRIDVVSVLDAQQGNLGVLRALGRIIAKIELSAGEKTAIGYQIVPHPSGAQLPAWNHNGVLPPKEIPLEEDEAARLCATLESFPHFRHKDRTWLEPLIESLRKQLS